MPKWPRIAGSTALAVLSCSCHRGPALHPLPLTDGCYYEGQTPIFKIVGHQGQLLTPGEVHSFNVETSGDAYEAHAIFSPGFLLYGEAPERTGTNDLPQHEYAMKAGTRTPTVNMVAWGKQDLARGKPC